MRHAWAGLCSALAVGSAVAWLAGNPDTWLWHAGRWTEQPWTLWTAALVHLAPGHWAGNVLALGALALLGIALRVGRTGALAWCLAWPAATASLTLWPAVTYYAGLSATVHAGVAVLAVACAFDRRTRGWALALATGLVLKLLGEQAWRQPWWFDPGWGFNVVAAAHLGGSLAGAACALLLYGAEQRLSRQRRP